MFKGRCVWYAALFFLSLQSFGQHSKLDLSSSEQKRDFLQYVQTSVSLLNDNRFKEMMKGYDLKNFTDSNKIEVAKKIMNDTAYTNRLISHFAFMQKLEEKYEISKFTNDDWAMVAQLGTANGIYFTDAMRKKMEQQRNIQGIPQLKVKDTISMQIPTRQ